MIDREDFNNWVYFKPDFKELAWLYNTGRMYQHKQDLISVFYNAYSDYNHKVKAYHKEFNKIPIEYLQELIEDFRIHFPLSGRVPGVTYFDDLINYLIGKYATIINKRKKSPIKSFSVPEFAMALFIKDIVISKRGVGNDGKNYTHLFNIASKNTLYIKLNEIQKDTVKQKTLRAKAEKIIKEFNL